MSLVAGTRFGPYEIQSAIGAGGMGEVYKARDSRLDRTVAIKVLPSDVSADPERRARFLREAAPLACDLARMLKGAPNKDPEQCCQIRRARGMSSKR
jgi:serine/threonine protein kinase